jgi:streptogramin lyase
VTDVDTRGRRAARELLLAADRLGPAPDLGGLRRRHRRRSLARAGLAVAAVGLVVALASQGLPALDRATRQPTVPVAPGPTPTTRAWPGVPGLDPHIRDAVPTGAACPCDLAAGPGGVWTLQQLAGGEGGRLLRVDPRSDEVVADIPVGAEAVRVLVGDDGTVWVLRLEPGQGDEELLQIDPGSNSIVRRIPFPALEPGSQLGPVLAGLGAVWVADSSGRLLRVDTASGLVRTVYTDRPLFQGRPYRRIAAMAAAGGWIWAASDYGLHRLDPRNGRETWSAIDGRVGQYLRAHSLAAGAGALWIAASRDNAGDRLLRVERLDPISGQAVAILQLGRMGQEDTARVLVAADERTVVVRRGPDLFLVARDGMRLRGHLQLPGDGLVAVGAGAVWATDPAHKRLLRIDPDA